MLTAGDVIDRAREDILKDIDASNLRWDDPFMFRAVRDAERDVYRRRPDSRYESEIATDFNIPAIASVDDELVISEHFITALVDFVCWRALLRDFEEASIKRAEYHQRMYIAGIK